jgi:zinc transport system ATP-binding protein
LNLKDITFGYREQPEVENVNLTIREKTYRNDRPNGGGKSTIIKINMGLITPWKGTVTIPNQVEIDIFDNINRLTTAFRSLFVK